MHRPFPIGAEQFLVTHFGLRWLPKPWLSRIFPGVISRANQWFIELVLGVGNKR